MKKILLKGELIIIIFSFYKDKKTATLYKSITVLLL